MPARDFEEEKVYPTYEPYPVSGKDRRGRYSVDVPPEFDELPTRRSEPAHQFDPLDLIADPTAPHWQDADDSSPQDAQGFRPLKLLHSLFADRLGLLNAALKELEEAKTERERLTAEALRQIDEHIAECDRWLGLFRLNRALEDFLRRRHFERTIIELKRQRRQESLMSWRDLLLLRREIQALHRELDSLGKTAGYAQKPEAGR